MPGVSIGEGAITEPNTVVTHSLDPWTIYGGLDCRKLGMRKPLKAKVPEK